MQFQYQPKREANRYSSFQCVNRGSFSSQGRWWQVRSIIACEPTLRRETEGFWETVSLVHQVVFIVLIGIGSLFPCPRFLSLISVWWIHVFLKFLRLLQSFSIPNDNYFHPSNFSNASDCRERFTLFNIVPRNIIGCNNFLIYFLQNLNNL